MSRRASSLVWRTPLAASIRASTRKYTSRSQIPPAPNPNNPQKPQSPPIKRPPRQSLDSPAVFSSLVSYESSPSTLSTDCPVGSNTRRARDFFKAASFLYSAADFKDHPYNVQVPEVVILGSSNVGKSTFLNALAGRPGIARTSARPGHTTLMNAYGLGPAPPPPPPPSSPPDSTTTATTTPPPHPPPPPSPSPQHSLIVVDTPGYGFRSQATWGETVVRYLGARKALRGAVVLVSAEKRLTPGDRWVLEALANADVRTLVVVTKADKADKAAARRDKQSGFWAGPCAAKAEEMREEMRRVERGTGTGWKEGAGWSSDVFVTAAGCPPPGKKASKRTRDAGDCVVAHDMSNKAGMGAVRAAILEMVGLAVKDNGANQQPQNISYTGKIVSFDDIVWKS
ncbi:hypothetical protein MY8738_003486 [Beauveria namnaoensis]